MTSTIRETIHAAVPQAGSYGIYVDAAVSALEARERDVAALCVSYAVDQGADGETTRRFLESIGMSTTPPPEPEPDNTAVDALAEALDNLQRQFTVLASEIENLRARR